MKRTLVAKEDGCLSIGYSIGISYHIKLDRTIELRHMVYLKSTNTFGFIYRIPKKYKIFNGEHFTPELEEILKSNNILSYDVWEKNHLKYKKLYSDFVILKQSILSGVLN